MLFETNVDLTSLNTMAIFSVAINYCEVNTVEQLKEAIAFAKQKKLSIYILGGGSNVILPSVIDGLVIHIAIKSRVVNKLNDHNAEFIIGAGENWHELVLFSLAQGYRGLENLSLIPGTVGAAPIQNIGAYGVEVKDSLIEVEVLDVESLQELTFRNNELGLGYRTSIFKENPGTYIITSITLCLDKKAELKTNYGDLLNRLQGNVFNEVDVSDAVIDARNSKLPDFRVTPNTGSFFKNPVVDASKLQLLISKYPNMVHYKMDASMFKLAAGWLIQEAGWKGYSNDRVGVHKNQALVLINHNKGSSLDILNLAHEIQESVNDKFSVNLEIEPVVF
jgi:UDP-N-acetylmuramate dehydrogenase